MEVRGRARWRNGNQRDFINVTGAGKAWKGERKLDWEGRWEWKELRPAGG